MKVQPPYLKFNESVPLIKYMPKIKEKKMRNLLDDSPQSMVKEKEEVDVNEDKTLYQYFKKELYLYLIYDTMSY
jgi:hypothetical protein